MQVREKAAYVAFGVDQHRQRERAMQDTLNEVAKAINDVQASERLGMAAVALSLILAAAQWLLGDGQAYLLGLSLAGLAAAFGLHCNDKKVTLQGVQRRAVEAADRGGFKTAVSSLPSGGSHRFSVALAPSIQRFVEAEEASSAVDADQAPNSLCSNKQHPTKAFAWSPTGYLGAIELKDKPAARLDRRHYMAAMQARITNLIMAEEEADARFLLKKVEQWDSRVPTHNLAQVAYVLVETSEWLHDKVQFPSEGVPVEQLEHDPELLAYLHEEDTLEAFLHELYPLRDDGY